MGTLLQRLKRAREVTLTPLRMVATNTHGRRFEVIAINEVSLLRSSRQTARISVAVDGRKRLADLACDGALVATPAALAWVFGGAQTHLTSNWVVVVIAGALVGLGTRMANGCTSGHGVCGISRLSLRGIVATVFYIMAGGLVMALARHGLGLI